MHKTTTPGTAPNPPPSDADGDDYSPALTVDFNEFAHFLDESDWTEEEKMIFLQKYWDIICDFVAIGFEVHSVQLACGQVSENDADGTFQPTPVLNSSHKHLIREFIKDASVSAIPGEEGVTP